MNNKTVKAVNFVGHTTSTICVCVNKGYLQQRIEQAQKNLEQYEMARIEAQDSLQIAHSEYVKIVEEMEALGVTPDTIQDEIDRLETEIEAQFEAALTV